MQSNLLNVKLNNIKLILKIIKYVKYLILIKQEQESREAHRKFIHSEGDHLTLLNVYRSFKGSGGSKVRLISPVKFLSGKTPAVNKLIYM